jgi:hypothetical protein
MPSINCLGGIREVLSRDSFGLGVFHGQVVVRVRRPDRGIDGEEIALDGLAAPDHQGRRWRARRSRSVDGRFVIRRWTGPWTLRQTIRSTGSQGHVVGGELVNRHRRGSAPKLTSRACRSARSACSNQTRKAWFSTAGWRVEVPQSGVMARSMARGHSGVSGAGADVLAPCEPSGLRSPSSRDHGMPQRFCVARNTESRLPKLPRPCRRPQTRHSLPRLRSALQ